MAVKNVVHHQQVFWVGCGWSLCRGSPGWYHSCWWARQQHQKVPLQPAVGDAAQRQGNKCCLPWGKCHPRSLKRAEPGLASCSDPCLPFSVDTFEMAKFWSHFSVFASTDFGGRWVWLRSKREQQFFRHAGVHSWTSNSAFKSTMSGLIVKDVEHPNSTQGHKRRSIYLTNMSFLTVSLQNFKPDSAVHSCAGKSVNQEVTPGKI